MAKAKKRDRDISFTRKEFLVFVSFVFVAMAIMFVLGIYVGRGKSPLRFDIQKLQTELAGLKAAMVRAEEAQAEALEKELAKQNEYDFFQQVRNPTGDLMLPEEGGTNRPAPKNTGPVHLKATKPPEISTRAMPMQEAPKAVPAPVQTQPAPQAPVRTEENYDFWTVQVAAVVYQQDAAKMVDKFIKMGYPAYMLEAHPEPGKTIYRVRMGHFKTREEAKELTQRLSKDWKDYLILKK